MASQPPSSRDAPDEQPTERSHLVLFALALAAIPASQAAPAADLLLGNARVYTVDAARPWAQAVAVRDGRIVAVGSDAELARWKGPGTRVVDLGGRLLLPAFGDAHVHPVFGGLSHSRCSLHEGESVQDYERLIAACVAAAPGTGTVYGVGWRDGLFPPDGVPRKEVLDAISSERALIFSSTGGHSMWLNSRALQIAGIDRDTPDPANGHIDRDPATGEPLGGLQEAAMELVQAQIPAPSERELQDSIAWAARHFNSLGITHWHDAGVEVQADGGSPVLEAYRAVRDRGELGVRVSIALGGYGTQWQDERSLEQLSALFRASAHARELGLAANSVKLYLDGVIVQRTAAMLEPYEESGDERGQAQIPEAVLRQAVQRIDAHGMQVHVHAIGDRAVRQALDAFAAAGARNGIGDNRHMISHLNVIDPADQPRFGQLGVAAVFQPLWACDEPYMRLTLQRIGPRRRAHVYPANGVLQAGGRLAYGSDWPVASANPLEGIEVALTRIAPGVHDTEPLLAEQRVTLAEAIKGYTLDVAYVNRIDGVAGSIAVGKSADLVVLDRDLFAIPAREISQAKVLLTLFEGRPVFGALDALGQE
ncbi:amidohydrolase [Flavobacterium sp. MXW15]|uniref:Amidohydrolase n=1 Tax=Xanthomonas chitinilytica TaxID=2989819 RepID=A0ABT3K0L0_9XANT|nr:amidohydrolase [Xanthomonas sp. H13-6]MCW4456569.1 amidohydrolase [Flavobacterium sp. MXW15]MCW4474272.1 amidohydrolase [Xanthomonas sp. H13-6]